MNKYGAEVVAEMITRLQGYNKKASGNLIKSLKYTIEQNGDVIELDIEGAPYWQYVDKGRKPGKFVPVSALQKWAALKGIPQSAVYPINLKIFRKGIAPTNFASTTLSRRKSKFEEMVALAYREDMIIYLDQLAREISD
jgi:hypothetical protein